MSVAFNNKVIAVAASSKGLGYAIALDAAKKGARVFIGSRNEHNVKVACNTIREETGGEVSSSLLDLKDPHSIQHWIDACISDFKRIDCLVVNTGGPKTGKFEDFNDSDWQMAYELVMVSAVRLIRSVLPVMKKNKAGSIVTITSSSIKEPIENLLFSNVMRAGVVGLIKTLSREFAPYNIRLNNAVPGMIHTDRLHSLDSEKAVQRKVTIEQVHKETFSTIPMMRYGQPHEFAKGVLFLLSDEASYITGSTLVIDGGKMRTLW